MPRGYLGALQFARHCTPDQARPNETLPVQAQRVLLDRIDLHVEVPALPAGQLVQAPADEATTQVTHVAEAVQYRRVLRSPM